MENALESYTSIVPMLFCETLSHVQEIYRKKSAEVSHKRRKEVEKLLSNEVNARTLAFACQSVLRAPRTGENHVIDDGFTLSLAYWTRAIVLMELKKYTWALRDLQAALKEGISDHLKAEAYLKMGICYKGKGEDGKANISFALARKLLEGNSRELKRIEEYRSQCFEEVGDVDIRVKPVVSGGVHPSLPTASEKINVKFDTDQGRYVVAGGEIKTGDVLVVEAPLAACLLPDCFATHCHHCFNRLVSPVGCFDCASIAFCTSECRDLALGSYHKYECRFLDLLIGSGMSILCHTALRMITQNSLDEVLSQYTKSRTYCTNSHLRPAEDFLQRTVMASFLLRCLQKSDYFIDGEANENVIPNEEEFKIGELLLYYLQILQFNAHEIYETRRDADHKFKNAKPGYIGVALYPTVALFNHDCYPAVTRYVKYSSQHLTLMERRFRIA
ncbi:hypothetical protein FQA39_LY19053 [Lamprigera yunnana]|nr:hypothetical protein FQA39_LY19053 [Lamprigera yunnana]